MPSSIPRSDRYRFFDGSNKLAPLLSQERLRTALGAAGQWLEAASEAAIADLGKPGLCYRTALYQEDGSVQWLYPNSNTSELIVAWLDLAEQLGDDRYLARAVAYADQYISDPVHGLYRGEKTEALGLAWYWREDGTYTGGYSMRAPEALQRLYAKTGDSRYLEAARLIGETFLARQLESGLVHIVGWDPVRGWGHPELIGCRYIYCVATFASLFEITGDERYRTAYERSMKALAVMQQADGSFFQNYHPETLAIPEPSIKPHFYAYIFNALMEAHRIFADERLLESARRLGRHIADHFYYRQSLPYCLYPHWTTDKAEAETAIHDTANGFLWLHAATGDGEWLDIGQKLWLQAWMTQADQPDLPHLHGGLLRGVSPDVTPESAPKAESASHLGYDAARVARSEIWFHVNFIFATRRLLSAGLRA